mmetsp:Transcript_78615/g.218277  ORF Transcript_78615/g.218277 Transcript_78615/m.218277 type:complete len:190 (+) Transcript_78615:306-875(+)
MSLTDEDIHKRIATSRRNILEHRFDVFRKRKPKAANKHFNQYSIAAGKTVLKAREIEKMATLYEEERKEREAKGLPPVEQENPVLSSLMTPQMSLSAFERYSARSRKRQGNKDSHRPSTGIIHQGMAKDFMEYIAKANLTAKEGDYAFPMKVVPAGELAAKRIEKRKKTLMLHREELAKRPRKTPFTRD